MAEKNKLLNYQRQYKKKGACSHVSLSRKQQRQQLLGSLFFLGKKVQKQDLVQGNTSYITKVLPIRKKQLLECSKLGKKQKLPSIIPNLTKKKTEQETKTLSQM